MDSTLNRFFKEIIFSVIGQYLIYTLYYRLMKSTCLQKDYRTILLESLFQGDMD